MLPKSGINRKVQITHHDIFFIRFLDFMLLPRFMNAFMTFFANVQEIGHVVFMKGLARDRIVRHVARRFRRRAAFDFGFGR